MIDVERDSEKAERIDRLADLGAEAAQRFGQDPHRVRAFLSHYFRHVDADEMVERPPAELLAQVVTHFDLASNRPEQTPAIAITDTTCQIVTDDQPFLVDSVSMEIVRQGWGIGEVFHPQFAVRRDFSGNLVDIVRTAVAERDPTIIRESWMSLDVTPPPGAGPGAAAELADGL